MKTVLVDSVRDATIEEREKIQKCLDTHSKDLHYLAFDRQLYGFSPLNCWLLDRSDILREETAIIDSIMKKKEICSLFPKERLSLYPFSIAEDGNLYNIELANIDKDFNDILKLNDEVYETKYLYVDFGHTPNNLEENYDLIIKKLQELLKKSKKLEGIYYII